LLGTKKRPIIFCSKEAHHSVHKAAKTVGLGYNSVIPIPVDEDLKLDAAELSIALDNCRKNNTDPLMIIGTAGTTGTGAIDDLEGISKIAKNHNIWFHVDAIHSKIN
jgi:glutamate/tyrosine decarboxylase-like PLP-dependent enzyme